MLTPDPILVLLARHEAEDRARMSEAEAQALHATGRELLLVCEGCPRRADGSSCHECVLGGGAPDDEGEALRLSVVGV